MFEFCGVNGDGIIEIYWKNNSWSVFWGYKNFKLTFFHPTKIFFEIRILNLI